MESIRRGNDEDTDFGTSKEDIEQNLSESNSIPKHPLDDSFYWNNRYFRILAIVSAIIFIPWFIHSGFRKGYFDPSVKDKVMVIYSMPETYFTKQQGMFAEFEAIVGALHYAEIHGAAGLRVNFVEESFYTRHKGDNWWAYFFEPNIAMYQYSAVTQEMQPPSDMSLDGYEEVHYNHWIARFGRLGSFSQILNGETVDSRHPWPIRGTFDTLRANQLVSRYIHLVNHELLDKVDALINATASPSDFLIGLHYRGTDKIVNYPYVTLSPAVWIYYIEEVKKVFNLNNDRVKLLIATDAKEFVDYVETHYPNKTIHIKESARLSLHDSRGSHKATDFTPKQKGEAAILDFLLLSRSHYLIKNRSSLSDASLMFSRILSLNFTMILGESDPVYHFGPQMPQPSQELWKQSF